MDRRKGYQRGMTVNWMINGWLPRFAIAVCIVFLESVAKSDALEAQSLGIELAYKTATLIDVYYAYLVVGYFEDDPIASYLSMNIVAQKVIDLGLSIQEVADLFKVEVDVMQKAVDKWSYLHSNRATLAQYKVIKDGI